MTIKQQLKKAEHVLKSAGNPSAALDARVLLAFALGRDSVYLIAHDDDEAVSEDKLKIFEGLIDLRRRGKPVAYLTNVKEFRGRRFYVDERVLIPRPETELLADEALNLSRKLKSPRILDLCCGSGCIGISVALENDDASVVMSDADEGALEVTKKNIALNPLGENRISVVLSDLFSQIKRRDFDIIVSNPPYISSDEMLALDASIADYEPKTALWGGNDGLMFHRKIISQSKDFLKNEGHLLLEIGYNQKKDVEELMRRAGYSGVKTTRDYSGLDRIVTGKK